MIFFNITVSPSEVSAAAANFAASMISAFVVARPALITANQPFGEWGKVFPDPAITLAAVDRLVHHAPIFEMNVESYRRKTAIQRRTGPGRPPARATISENIRLSRHDNQLPETSLPASNQSANVGSAD
jgi:hypothetical protein